MYSFKICAFDIVLYPEKAKWRHGRVKALYVYYSHYSKAMHVHQYELISIVKNVFYLDMFQTLNENNIWVFFQLQGHFSFIIMHQF